MPDSPASRPISHGESDTKVLTVTENPAIGPLHTVPTDQEVGEDIVGFLEAREG